jgi:hypothetical protein
MPLSSEAERWHFPCQAGPQARLRLANKLEEEIDMERARPSALAAGFAGLLLAAATPAAALDLNGFMPEAGHGDVALSFATEGYDEFWVGETKVSDPGVGEVETTSITLWAQFGFTDNFALVANLPYVDTDSDGLGGFEDSGLQDVAALAKFRFAQIESSSGLRHSFIAAAGGSTPASDYEANLPVDLGDGTTDFQARFVYQLESEGFYFSQQVGYDVRGDDAPDGFPLLTELGYTFGRVTINAAFYNYIADGGTDIGDPGFTFPSNQDETQRLGAKIFARFSDAFGAAAGYFTTLDGRNSGNASGFSLSGVFRY